ncbi:trypsin-like peptidase domain-containing protein [Streptomyces shenzhenensis]|uniref:trypsin-like peptidase domain-containing protein n=1 Tax=Streptomyces shenzhenensis TaxID=943815 RepID=UPI00369929C9
MAVRGPRTGGSGRAADGAGRTREAARHKRDGTEGTGEADGRPPAQWAAGRPDASLVQIRDLAGRPRGTGFPADHHGTVVTSHEAVDGLARLVLHAGERTCVVTAAAVTPLPHLDLALVRAEGLDADPLPVTTRERIQTGSYVRIAAGGWREARVLGAAEATYTATDRFHLLDGALELAIGTAGRDALRLGGGAAGGPVLDARTGAVVAVLGTALRSDHRDAGFAVPLRRTAPGSARTGRTPGADPGPLADLLARNAATVPAYGADLNLAGVLEITATSLGQDGPPGALAGYADAVGSTGPGPVEPVQRDGVTRELTAFTEGDSAVLGLVGAPGSGRTTELAALAARRDRGPAPAPTLWLRGADLSAADGSVADAARRALDRAARIVAATRSLRPGDLGDLTPERLARLAERAGRPLLLLLDAPEEMPPGLAHRLAEWTEGTAAWLRATGARLVVACREEYWEDAGAEFPRESLYPQAPADGAPPPCVRLGDLTPAEARRARSWYAVPDGALSDRDARHPLTLRLLAEVRAALPAAPAAPPLDRHQVFSAHLDLMCLRVAERLAAGSDLRGPAVRRLAARVSGRVHEAARRSLGPGQGELTRDAFDAVFPWGPVPDRPGGGTGWASAVLAEGLLVPAGDGYRFAHEEFADWIQGMHLDLDEALHALVHRPCTPAHPLPLPRHRVGPVVQALLLLARQQGPGQLASRLAELTRALDTGQDPGCWWAARLLAGALAGVPDATPYTDVLRLLADRIVTSRRTGRPVPAEFAPAFWTALPLPVADRLDLLRELVLADEPHAPGPRYLDAVARLLTDTDTDIGTAFFADTGAAGAVHALVSRWFDDERAIPGMPRATVATAAQALLHTHRHPALDALVEVLADRAHRRADDLLAALAEDEPSAVCRAVHRWAHDDRPARRAAAVVHGLRAALHADTDTDRDLLRQAARTLLDSPADTGLHGGALALLVHDPDTRARHLPQALRHFASGDPRLPPSALVPALATHPDQVLDAFGDRLRAGPDPREALRTLAHLTPPGLARRAAALVREAAALRPETAAHLAEHVDRRLDHGPAARTVLLPLVTALLDDGPEPVRAALATVLAAPGTPASRPLRRELLDFLFARERDPGVLDALLHAAAQSGATGVRDLVHRTGLLLIRTPDGATRFDRGLVDLGRRVPGFAALMARWLTDTPEEWAAVVGPSTRRMLGNLAGVRVPA